jgi:hypothetical protein
MHVFWRRWMRVGPIVRGHVGNPSLHYIRGVSMFVSSSLNRCLLCAFCSFKSLMCLSVVSAKIKESCKVSHIPLFAFDDEECQFSFFLADFWLFVVPQLLSYTADVLHVYAKFLFYL